MASRLRAVVLEALHHYGCPLGHGELAAYAAAVHGVPVAEGDLPALVDAECHAHAAGERRDVWVCPTMLADPFLDEGVLVDDGMVTRSDWELSERVVDAQPPPSDELELRFRLMLWSEMAEDTFGSLAVLDEDLRHSKADYLARQFQRPEARLFGDVRVPSSKPSTTPDREAAPGSSRVAPDG